MRTGGLSGTLVADVYKLDFGTMALYGVDQQRDGGIERFTTELIDLIDYCTLPTFTVCF